MERVGEQMVVSALLTAELVYAVEAHSPEAEAQVTQALRRVIARSSAVQGYPLVDEFWITDERGEARMHTAPQGFSFQDPEARDDQAQAFLPLLTADAAPVIQELRPRALDGKCFQYVGVGGVDKPRIIQVGVGEGVAKDIKRDFQLQHFIENFIDDRSARSETGSREEKTGVDALIDIGTDIVRIVVLDADGTVLAEAGAPAVAEGPIADPQVMRFCREFLDHSEEHFAIDAFEADIGVVSRLDNPAGGQPMALFIQHHTEAYLSALLRQIKFILALGAVLIVLALLGSLYLGRKLTRPLTQLHDEVYAFGQGDLDRRIQMNADKEFQDLADSFNVMADSLQSHVRELKQETQRRERLESELRIAAELQRSLLPKAPPETPGLELAGWSLPAREVGGDFFDFIPIDHDHLAIVIGDGTDKGLPAAMLIAECWNVLRTLAETIANPAELLARTNQALYRRIGDSGRFVTLFFMIIECRTGKVQYAMAGHNPPLLLKAGASRAQQLRSEKGLPLGIEGDCVFESIEVSLAPGDCLLLYSDGATEAPGKSGDLYGLDRLEGALLKQRESAMAALLDAVKESIEAFSEARELWDDVTLVGIRYTGNPDTAAVQAPPETHGGET